MSERENEKHKVIDVQITPKLHLETRVNGTLVPGVTIPIEKVQIEIKIEGDDLVVLSQKK